MIILDTDILSMFAKTEALNVLVEFMGRENIRMTPAIAEEISVPLQYGYDFSLQVLSQIPIVPIGVQVVEELGRLQTIGATIGKRFLLLTTFGIFAQNRGVEVIYLQAILRVIWVSGIRTKAGVRELLEQIKNADRLVRRDGNENFR